MQRFSVWFAVVALVACSTDAKPKGDPQVQAEPAQVASDPASQASDKPRPVPSLRDHLSPLAPEPDWSRLDAWQGAITRAEFERLLREVYILPDGDVSSIPAWIALEPGRAVIETSPDATAPYQLRFADAERPLPAAGRSATEAQPLRGLTIAIDPGHIGGAWAQTEWRWFRIGDSEAVAEGDLTLVVAEHLTTALRALGAEVTAVRTSAKPVADVEPATLEPVARKLLVKRGALHQGLNSARRRALIREESTRLAFRTSEIRARAERINRLEPDLTICIHFNAEKWERPGRASLTDKNHMHLIVNGAYMPEELAYEDIRLDMLHKLVARTHEEEMAIARHVARALATATGLPAESYPDSMPVRRMSEDGYIWARNLLANRIYRGPVLYLEPYVMNSHDVYARLQAGDYEGVRYVASARRPSIFREYADAVVSGLLAHYRAEARASP